MYCLNSINFKFWLIHRDSHGAELPQSIANKVMIFQKKQARGYIDVWWLYDDGGKIRTFKTFLWIIFMTFNR